MAINKTPEIPKYDKGKFKLKLIQKPNLCKVDCFEKLKKQEIDKVTQYYLNKNLITDNSKNYITDKKIHNNDER